MGRTPVIHSTFKYRRMPELFSTDIFSYLVIRETQTIVKYVCILID